MKTTELDFQRHLLQVRISNMMALDKYDEVQATAQNLMDELTVGQGGFSLIPDSERHELKEQVLASQHLWHLQ